MDCGTISHLKGLHEGVHNYVDDLIMVAFVISEFCALTMFSSYKKLMW